MSIEQDITVIVDERDQLKEWLRKSSAQIHYMEPQYLGNPTEPEKGSLVFNDFGIDILEKLKEAGFNDAYFVAYYSVSKCYMGYLPLIIEAVK